MIEIGGNTWAWGALYVSGARHKAARGPLVQRSWINEPEAPWRHGRGLALRLTPWHTVQVGKWHPTTEERPGYTEDELPDASDLDWLEDADFLAEQLDLGGTADDVVYGEAEGDVRKYERWSLSSSG